MQGDHCPGVGTRQLHGGLGGLDVHEWLVQRDDIADGDLPFDDLGLGEALADVGQDELLGAQLSYPITRSTASSIRSTLGR